jgi:Protein of unknown function (DUF3097)
MARMDRYGPDALSTLPPAPKPALPRIPAEPGLVVEDVETGWVGAVLRTEKIGGMHIVVLEDRHLKTRTFPLGPGFWVDGTPVILVRADDGSNPANPAGAAVAGPARTASGSVAVAGLRARTARASRILVEGKHDAELVEKVWGHDLRVEGVVVEMLNGVDDLAAAVAGFRPGPGRRLGVLVDHLVAGSKEWKEAEGVARLGAMSQYVLVVGHPYIDVWQAVHPDRLGIRGVTAWPHIPKGQPWKEGTLAALGWPHQTQADVAQGWRRILSRVTSYADLEPDLLGRVEELIDFVTGDDADR